jgi:peptidoglycan hydrolase-like protein with peptidoglycan-binding domain
MLNTIKHQDTGDLVKVAQYLIGYAARKEADGIFSANFVTAVCTVQRKLGLSPDGVIGPKTWAAIADHAPTCSTSKNRTSAATCAIQILLGGLEADGIFGSKTKNAVAAYQKAKGLKADGICCPKTWEMLIEGAAISESDTPATGKLINDCVHYVQWDSRWSKKKYSTHASSQTIGNSGCGPTAMAMICAQWIDPKLTPVELCELALKNGYRTYNSGTDRGFMKFCFGRFAPAFKDFVRTSNVSTMIAAIQSGALAVCSMNNNDHCFWTSGGHYITVIGFDGTYVYANDPNKTAHPRKQKLSAFKKCMNEAMIFWKNDVAGKEG